MMFDNERSLWVFIRFLGDTNDAKAQEKQKFLHK